MLVKVVRNSPAGTGIYQQDDISKIIGKVFEVVSFDKEDNSVSVIEDQFWQGEIVLNKDEYEVVE